MNVVAGVFRWSDGTITAACIRDDMFAHASVELLAETFFFEGALELCHGWICSCVRFVTKDEFIKLSTSSILSNFEIIGSGIAKVKFDGKDETLFYVTK